MVDLISYPVTTRIDGIVENTFPGFDSVEILFKREDVQIESLGLGLDNKIEISVSGDITGFINVDEFVYLSAVATTYNYDLSVKVLSITYNNPSTIILLDTEYIESSSSGYINYLQNWVLEAELVDKSNVSIKKVDFKLRDSGTVSGSVNIDVSIAVDNLQNCFREDGGEVDDGRIEFKVRYRELYRESQDTAFTLIDEIPIIIYFAATKTDVETFVSGLPEPKFWAGYLTGVSFLHSSENYDGEVLKATFDELDINKQAVTENNLIRSFNLTDYGFLYLSTKDISGFQFSNITQYVNVKMGTDSPADYNPDDYNNNDYFTQN